MSRYLPPLRLFGVFETVCRSDNLRAAAAALNVSQPAVSQSLKQLEDHIGARLINRETRPASLTREGEILLRATEDGLARISGAVEEIRRRTTRNGSAVTVSCSVGVATHWLMPHLESFYMRHADIQVNVITSESGAPAIARDIDIAIRFGDGNWSDGAVTRLFDERIMPVCTPELAASLGLTKETLHTAPMIHVETVDPRWLGWTDYLATLGLGRATNPVQLRFSNYVQATQAALAGRGLALGWRSITGGYEAEGRLVAPVAAPLTPPSAFFAVTAHDREAEDATMKILTWLSEIGAMFD
ncbi:LysR substrate-binding domain-containing protein [Nisaea acidiphila]|uniref:LysR substrate-binding domain-containing protein n=1 Tax=Nisaea acidiphila TaxID=1862145 RepID=A0A9J7AU56_9PROT|nr:LysR substrate-binding domain-containing protein [Nisaea acidiphila]UUX50855.1 LysR substrate-binding domain-containing protein [Nisaea acidiphila]